MAGIRGYNPSKLQRNLFSWKQGVRSVLSNAQSWKRLLSSKKITELYHYWLFQGLCSKSPFLHPGGDYIPYHWVVKYLEVNGFVTKGIGGIAPFTIDAHHPQSGLHLYFRSRSTTTLTLYTDKDNMWDSIVYREEFPRVDYLYFEDEVLQHLHFMLTDIKDNPSGKKDD